MKKHGRLKFHMLLYFLLFATIIISLLWLFQMTFFEGFYQSKKFQTMKDFSEQFKSVRVGDEKFNELNSECDDVGIDVFVISHDHLIFPNDQPISESNGELIKKALIKCMKSNDEEFIIGIEPNGKSLGIFYCAIRNDDGSYTILTSSHAELKETIIVIRMQFIYTTVIVVVIGILLAWFLATRTTKPIVDMSQTAKKWADGDESVTFNGGKYYAELNELAETLNYAKQSVSKAGVLQRDLLANVSHDLKTPLTMIKAYAEMIKDISGDNKIKRDKHTQVIMEEADRLTMLVNDILNLSKLQSSVDELEKREVNLSLLTERVIDRFSSYVENQGYTIENHIAPDLLTIVDEQKIEQVIYNLLGNSINYTGENKTVKVYLTAQNDKIILEIIDSGKGISQEKINTIWERYYRFSETNTRPVKGTGLGLSIVKTILEAHNLRFGVRSKKDYGSNFYVEFDRVKNE